MASAQPSAAPRPASSVRRVIVASLVGTSLEWYDFFIYGQAAALVFNEIFFPQYDPLVGTLAPCSPSRPTPWDSSPGPLAASSSVTTATSSGARTCLW